jgi:hypothetical protein
MSSEEKFEFDERGYKILVNDDGVRYALGCGASYVVRSTPTETIDCVINTNGDLDIIIEHGRGYDKTKVGALIHSDILIDLLRSAGYEISRPSF